jgi:hypothetical protein
MRILSTLLITLGLTLCVCAQDYSYQAPSSTDKRSPCPAVNALANHGYLNRNGVGILPGDLANAVIKVYNVEEAIGQGLAANTIKLLGYTNANGTQVFDLDALSKHGIMEHDASLTRHDFGDADGDNHSPQPALIEQLKAFSPDGTTLSWTEMAKARNLRVKQESASDPSYNLPQAFATAAISETCFTLRLLGTGEEIPLDWVDSWFGQDKIPDGWTTPATTYTMAQNAIDVQKVLALTQSNLV